MDRLASKGRALNGRFILVGLRNGWNFSGFLLAFDLFFSQLSGLLSLEQFPAMVKDLGLLLWGREDLLVDMGILCFDDWPIALER